MYLVSIPEISDEELLERYAKIKPIIEYNGKKHYLREFSEHELRNNAYIYKADINVRDVVDMSLLVSRPDMEFECLHTFGYPGFFKPSIAEVLAQIPESELPFVDAFEIVKFPNACGDFMKNKIIFNNGYHVSIVRLYTSRNNPNVNFVD